MGALCVSGTVLGTKPETGKMTDDSLPSWNLHLILFGPSVWIQMLPCHWWPDHRQMSLSCQRVCKGVLITLQEKAFVRASMVADVKCLAYNSGSQAMTTIVRMPFVLNESPLLVALVASIGGPSGKQSRLRSHG